MKKNIFSLFVLMAMFSLVGCSAKDEATFFIPTPSEVPEYVEPEVEEEEPEEVVEEEEEPVYTGETTLMYVRLSGEGAKLNVRTAPSRDSDIAGILTHGEQINVIEIKDGWASIVYNNQICYVSDDYIGYKKPSPITPAPEVNISPETQSEDDPDALPPEI